MHTESKFPSALPSYECTELQHMYVYTNLPRVIVTQPAIVSARAKIRLSAASEGPGHKATKARIATLAVTCLPLMIFPKDGVH